MTEKNAIIVCSFSVFEKKKEAKTLFCFWYVFLWFSCIAQLHYSFEWFPRLNIYRSWFYNTVDWLWRLVTCMQLVSKLMFLTLNNCLLLISCPVILNSKVWPCFTANIHCVALQAVCLNMTPQEEKKKPNNDQQFDWFVLALIQIQWLLLLITTFSAVYEDHGKRFMAF